jgi:hypothetical protein
MGRDAGNTVLVTFTACKENTKSAKQYHDTIYQSVDTIISNVFALDNHLQNDSVAAARASFDRLKGLIDEQYQVGRGERYPLTEMTNSDSRRLNC